MPTIDNWRALREALDAGPDEGPWVSAGPSYGAALPVHCNEVIIDREGDDEDTYQVCRAPLGLDAESTANMNYIGEASPKVIRSLLDERDRLAAEVDALRAVEQTARVYFEHYLQDEAEDVDCCICGDEQHNRAKLLRGALKLAKCAAMKGKP